MASLMRTPRGSQEPEEQMPLRRDQGKHLGQLGAVAKAWHPSLLSTVRCGPTALKRLAVVWGRSMCPSERYAERDPQSHRGFRRKHRRGQALGGPWRMRGITLFALWFALTPTPAIKSRARAAKTR
jgi:hypothetical protein